MKNKKIEKFIIFFIIIVISIRNISFSKNDYRVVCSYNTQIAKPIFDVKIDDIIEQEIIKENFPIEYFFYINNYIEDEVNEIDFNYTIEVKFSNQNFPVSCTLVDCISNEQIDLVNGESKVFSLDKFHKMSKKFKLHLEWKEMDTELSEDLDINLKINAVQKEKENEI